MTLVTLIRDLHRRKARERRGLALAEGVRLVEEMVAANVRCKGALVSPSLDATERGQALRARLVAGQVDLHEVSDDELAEAAATEQPQGIVAAYEPAQWQLADLMNGIGKPLLVLDAVQDPGNVGTIARTALAFGAAGIVALPGTADLTNPKTVRGAMGALFRLPHLHADDESVLSLCAERDIETWAATMDGGDIDELPTNRAVALIVGNEGAGIRDELLARVAHRVTIRIQPDSESLNVAVATGILLHRMAR